MRERAVSWCARDKERGRRQVWVGAEQFHQVVR
jgi:hypothetical protein